MANDTVAERQQTAERQLREKLRLERPLAAQSRTILRNMSDDLATVYAATGTIINAEEYRDDWIGTLRPHYRKAERSFGRDLDDVLAENPEDEDAPFELLLLVALAARRGSTVQEEVDRFKADRDAALVRFTNTAVPVRADLITQTNQRELERSVATATAQIIEEGETPTRQTVAVRAKRNFRDSSLYRGNVIAATEIQNAAEGTKDIEAETFNQQVRPLETSGDATIERFKEWHTQGDERVRPAHVAADLQRVGFDQAFTVDGERLRFPGDSSLGASAGNTINCRCAAVYKLEGSVVRVQRSESDTGFFGDLGDFEDIV